jgi:hypothetical protein
VTKAKAMLVDIRPESQRALDGYITAAALQELGLWRATDIVGGIKAWREEGLPIAGRL